MVLVDAEPEGAIHLDQELAGARGRTMPVMVLGLRDVDAAVLLAPARRILETAWGVDANTCHGVHERRSRPNALHPGVRRTCRNWSAGLMAGSSIV